MPQSCAAKLAFQSDSFPLIKDESADESQVDEGVDDAPCDEREPVRHGDQEGSTETRGCRSDADADDGQHPPPEIAHVEPDPPLVVPVHERSAPEDYVGDVADRRGPVADARREQHREREVQGRHDKVANAARLVPVLGALDLDAGVLHEGDEQRRRHSEDEPVGVPEPGARPRRDEETSDDGEAAEHPHVEDRLVAADLRHEAGEHRVVVRLGDDAVDLGDEHVGHRRGQRVEDRTDLDCHGKHRHDGRAGERAEQDVGDVLVDELADLVQEDPRAEGGDRLEQRRVEAPDVEAHAQASDAEGGVEGEQNEVHRELRRRNANDAHPREEQRVRKEGRGERGGELAGLLEAEPLVGHDVRVEHGVEQRRGDAAGQDRNDRLRRDYLLRREAV